MTRYHRPCPSCHGPCQQGKYLCRQCWYLLPPAARSALSKHDKRAAGRLRELLEQLAQGAILDKIEISP